ncbi:unnamed protein product [Angiostrongylus costaricensis]|uniref:Uncharacterized protein n=1 Tax=Angiostrongylus costaricensis TaxID=334426 RepID=A0A158PHA5_ANGCS|nr:unnamed protein product [Angiostrongylus costaricensis]
MDRLPQTEANASPPKKELHAQNTQTSSPPLKAPTAHSPTKIREQPRPQANTPLTETVAVERVAKHSQKEGKGEYRKGDKVPARSARSIAERAEFVPPIEYLDVSRIAIRFLQSLMFCEMLLHLFGIPLAMHEAQLFFNYRKGETKGLRDVVVNTLPPGKGSRVFVPYALSRA